MSDQVDNLRAMIDEVMRYYMYKEVPPEAHDMFLTALTFGMRAQKLIHRAQALNGNISSDEVLKIIMTN